MPHFDSQRVFHDIAAWFPYGFAVGVQESLKKLIF